MERVEYFTSGNEVGISIKYPDGWEIREKWSERYREICCGNCDSENLSSAKTGETLMIACLDCPTYWVGAVDEVLTWYDTEEALVQLWKVPFERA